MSLVKKPRMTEKRLAALAKMRKKSRGPSTAEGRERIRAAHLRHGFYSKSDEAALRGLGEDPAKFRQVLEGFSNPHTIGGTLQEAIAHRLARAYWRMDRADRMQDGHALRHQAREAQGVREGRLHMQMMRLKITSRKWHLLAYSIDRPYFVITTNELNFMRELHREGAAKEMSEVALALCYQLRQPGLPGPGEPGFEDEEQREQQERVLMRIKDIFGLNEAQPFDPAVNRAYQRANPNPGVSRAEPVTAAPSDASPTSSAADQVNTNSASGQTSKPESQAEAPPPPPPPVNPYPHITESQWEAREPVRQLLQNLLTRQVEIFDAQHHELMRQNIKGPTPYERAAEIVPKSPEFELMERMEFSNCRQLLRLGGLLIRLRRQELQMEEVSNFDASVDVEENNES